MVEIKQNLLDVKEILDNLEVIFWLDSGSLLFAYRNNSLDLHDTDLGVRPEGWKILKDNIQLFKDKGFNIFREYTVPSGKGSEITFERYGHRLDIFTKERAKDGTSWWLSTVQREDYPFPEIIVYRVPSRHYDNLNTIEFLGTTFSIPSDTEEYLVTHYGEDWRTPKSWCYWKDAPCIDNNVKIEDLI